MEAETATSRPFAALLAAEAATKCGARFAQRSEARENARHDDRRGPWEPACSTGSMSAAPRRRPSRSCSTRMVQAGEGRKARPLGYSTPLAAGVRLAHLASRTKCA